MRLTDILKKKKTSAPPSSNVSTPAVAAASASDFDSTVVAVRPRPQPDSPAPPPRPPVFRPTARQEEAPVVSCRSNVAASDIFARAISSSREVFAAARASKRIGAPAVIGEIVGSVREEPSGMLLCVPRTTADHYIYSHSVNVCVISSIIADRMGFPEDEMSDLALAAFLHDIGMAQVQEIVALKPKLSSSETQKMKEHPALGQNFVDTLTDVAAAVKERAGAAILQIHERSDGSGYPKGLKNSKISEFARIIAVADAYEAMTHPRCYKNHMIPHEAIKTLINESENNFDNEVMKSFITVMSLYPVGSYVRLSNGEVAKVVSTNENMPTRPKVKIAIDQAGKRSADERVIDLEEVSIVSIREAADETKLKVEPKILLELQTQKWWIM